MLIRTISKQAMQPVPASEGGTHVAAMARPSAPQALVCWGLSGTGSLGCAGGQQFTAGEELLLLIHQFQAVGTEGAHSAPLGCSPPGGGSCSPRLRVPAGASGCPHHRPGDVPGRGSALLWCLSPAAVTAFGPARCPAMQVTGARALPRISS